MAKIETYTMLTGETITYPAGDAAMSDFMAQVVIASTDPNVSQNDLIELIYGKESPLMDQTIFPGRGAVTKAVFADPRYSVMLDLLDHKRVQLGILDVGKALEAFTMTVPEAAKALKVHETSVRYAIRHRTISAIKKGNRYLIDPDSLDTYEIGMSGRQGHAFMVRARIGSREGESLRIKTDGTVDVVEKDGHQRNVEISEWKTIVVAHSRTVGGKKELQVMRLVPNPSREEALWVMHKGSPFNVNGAFVIEETSPHTYAASLAWKDFDGAAA